MKQRFATVAGGGSPSAVFFRWLGWMLALNVTWEIAQMPLYTLPPARFPFYTAYSVAHCSVGDMLIATAVYFGAAVAAGWRWPIDAPLRGLSALLPLAVAYTAYSEWRNVYVTGSWGYDATMPMLVGLGLSALACRRSRNGWRLRQLQYSLCGEDCADDFPTRSSPLLFSVVGKAWSLRTESDRSNR